jgi:predicted DsbA family dithiol-disulfide isomerase
MQIEIWADVVCPWCGIEQRRVQQALASFAHRDEVTVTWRSFLLDPDATSDGRPVTERLAHKYGVSPQDAAQMQARVTAIAAQDGLDFHLDRSISASSVDAHRLLHLATDRGRHDELRELITHAYFVEGVDIGDHDELLRLAAEAGLEYADAAATLAGDAYLDEVRADLAQAQAYGITGVPFMVLDGRLAVSGAQSTEVLTRAIEQAWHEAQPS